MDYDRLYYLNGLNPDKTPMLGGPIANADCPEGGGNNCVLRNDGSISPLDSVVASNLENQSVDEYIIGAEQRSEEHTSELQSLMRISYAVFCLKKKKNK